MDPWIYDIIGTIGAALIVLAYFIMQRRIIAGNSFLFNFCNGSGAAMILLSLTRSFNLSVFLMESAVILISLYGMGKALKAGRIR